MNSPPHTLLRGWAGNVVIAPVNAPIAIKYQLSIPKDVVSVIALDIVPPPPALPGPLLSTGNNSWISPDKWLKTRPDSGLDCLVCAEFARYWPQTIHCRPALNAALLGPPLISCPLPLLTIKCV